MLYEFFNFQCDACIAVNYADAVLHEFVKCQCVTCIAVNHADVAFFIQSNCFVNCIAANYTHLMLLPYSEHVQRERIKHDTVLNKN